MKFHLSRRHHIGGEGRRPGCLSVSAGQEGELSDRTRLGTGAMNRGVG